MSEDVESRHEVKRREQQREGIISWACGDGNKTEKEKLVMREEVNTDRDRER